MQTVPIFKDPPPASGYGVRVQTSHRVWVSHKPEGFAHIGRKSNHASAKLPTELPR
jgi:hypothetical protein